MTVLRRALSAADRRRVLAVTHAANASPDPLAHYQAVRLRLPRRHGGVWWLLEDGGEAVCSLMAYPLSFAVGQRVVPGHGLGAVATLPAARGRGFATALCRRAIEEAEGEGRRLGLLFSAIPAPFYERLGYRVVPAWNHVIRDLAALAASGPAATLVPIDPRSDVPTWLGHYRAAHPGAHLFRDEAAWHESLLCNGPDVFHAVGDPARGYVRVLLDEPGELFVVELMAPPADHAPVLRALATLGLALRRNRIEGWFDPVPALAEHVEDSGRARTLPMLRGDVDPTTARFWGSDFF